MTSTTTQPAMKSHIGTSRSSVQPAAYEFSGRVIDEDGHLLDNVDVTVTKVKSGPLGEPIEVLEKHHINETFDLKLADCDRAYLDFVKIGYYPRMITLPRRSSSLPASGTDIVRKYENEKVVLERVGNVTVLSRVTVVLEAMIDGDRVALTDKAFESEDPHLWIQRIRPEFSRDHVVIEMSATQEDKRFQVREIRRPNSEVIDYVPRQFELTIRDGGFIRYEPKEPVLALREMKEAPRDGYEKVLTIEGDYHGNLPAINPEGMGIFFFFKYKEIYGKGFISEARALSSGDIVLVGLQLRAQRDGSRNLETGE